MRKITAASFGMGRKIEPISVKSILGILIIVFSITGCSDMRYTTTVLTVPEVNRYLVATDGNAVCFQNDLSSTCIKLIPGTQNGADATNPSTIHIYPEKRLYLFYHEGNPILRAERARITQALTDASGDNGNNNNGDGGNNNNNNGDNGGGRNNNNDNSEDNGGGRNNNNGNNGDNGDGRNNNNDNSEDNGGGRNNNNGNDNDGNSDDGHGWIIWVYYPDGTTPDNPPALSESGVAVTINGKLLTDNDITGFAQFIGTSGENGIQFFYPTQSAELLDLKVRLEGVVGDDETAKFNINYLWESS